MNKDENKPVAAALPASDEQAGYDHAELREAVSDFRKATYEFARGQLAADYALMLESQGRIFDYVRALPAPALPVVPEGRDLAIITAAQHYLVDVVRSFGDVSCATYISTWHKPEVIAKAIAAAPTPPVEQPSQPQDQSGSIRPSAEPAGQLDAAERELASVKSSPVPLTLDELACFHRFCECAEDFDSGGHDVSKAMMSQLTRIGLVRPAGPGRHMTTKFGDWLRSASTSPIAEPDTATQAPSKSIDESKLLKLICAWEESPRGAMAASAFDEITSFIHSWHQRATQVAKPLTDAQIGNINRAALALKLAGYGDLAESMYSIHSYLKGE